MFHKKIVFLVFLFVILLSITAAQMLPSFGTPFTLNGWTINTVNTGVVLLDSSTYTIDAHGICKTVQSADGGKYFIPTRTLNEWNTFINNSPTGINVNSCPLVCNSITWKPTNLPTSNWYQVDISADGQTIIGIISNTITNTGADDYVYISYDGGNTYVIKNPGNTGWWADVAISADGQTMMLHSINNYFWISRDGGVTWEQITALGTPRLAYIAISPDGQKIAVANSMVTYGTGGGGYIYLSNDGGHTWTQQTVPGYNIWSDIEIVENNPDIVYAIYSTNNNTVVYKTDDFGITWQIAARVPFSLSGSWYADIHTSPSGKYVIFNGTKSSATVYLSNNYGNTWQLVNVPSYIGIYNTSTSSYFDTVINDAGVFCIRRSAKPPVCSFDGGNNFVEQNTMQGVGAGYLLNAISGFNSNGNIFVISGNTDLYYPGNVYVGTCSI